ncbi:DUF4282 domain-containing protein [Fretibacter rubidus]|uniref:DUF4282 domain-containing protein n=1 Tax=Fretibacter rubidus TaxID=570162 RepID=UPI00352ADBB2
MKNLFNFFFSFDKLMKEGLVRGFFWLSLISIALQFASTSLSAIRLGPLASVFNFVQFFVGFLLAVVVLRLICELAIAIFRINDNVSPDGGKSETADIDPVMEARRAAEQAAKRAQELSKSAVDKTSAATKSASEKTRETLHDVGEKVSDAVPSKKASGKSTASTAANDSPDRTIAPEVTLEPKAPPKKRPTSPKKPAAKKPVAKKATVKKPAAKATTAKKGPTLNKDGTPRKKRAPNKPKS